MKKLYYWIIPMPLITLAGVLFIMYSSEARFNEVLQVDAEIQNSAFNKQLQALGYMHTQSIVAYEEKIKILERHVVEMDERHKEEIGEVVKFYTDVLEEAKD